MDYQRFQLFSDVPGRKCVTFRPSGCAIMPEIHALDAMSGIQRKSRRSATLLLVVER